MDLLTYLKQEPRARERKNKNRAIGNLIIKIYPTLFEGDPETHRLLPVNKDKMSDMVGEILSLDRKWRKILEDNPDLRGTDYADKTILEQEKMLELDYQPTLK